MAVVVIYNGKKYQYTEVNQISTWVDENGNVAILKLHTILREKALASGVDPSIFICKNIKIPILNSVVEKNTNKPKNKIQGVINPFKK